MLLNIFMRTILFAFIALFNFALAQQWQDISLEEFRNEILKNEKTLASNQIISYNAELIVYSSHTNFDTLSTTSTNYFINNKVKLLNLWHLGNLVIQDSKHHIVCDTANKLVMIMDYKAEYFKQKQFVDFEDLLKSECKAKKRNVANGGKIIHLSFPQGVAFLDMEIHFDSQGYIVKYVFNSNAEIIDNRNWKIIERVKPRLEIYIRDYKFGKSSDKIALKSVSEFIKDFEKMELTDKYSDFELVDMRTFKVEDLIPEKK